MKYELPKLPYAYHALEPFIDKETLEIHHGKHHQAYTDKMNALFDKYPALSDRTLEDVFQNLDELAMDEADKKAFRNNAGGYWNHKLYFESMGPKKEVDEKLVAEIKMTFGSIDEFKTQFSAAAMNRFGSGYAWLCRDTAGKLVICSTKNQNNPFKYKHTPIFTIDVWEHAYYLKYRNRRDEYIKQWWNVLKVLP